MRLYLGLEGLVSRSSERDHQFINSSIVDRESRTVPADTFM